MYSLVTAVLKERNSNKPWSEVDLNNVSARDFLNNYISGYVVLTNISLPGEHIVDYMSFLTQPLPQPLVNITFVQWLALIGNRVLPTISEPDFKYGEAWWSPICKANWELQKAHPISPSTQNYTPADLVDGLLTKGSVSMDVYGDYILVTQNGLLHFSYPTPQGLKVSDLTQSFYSSNKNSVGVMSFTDIGKVKQVPVTIDNLIPVDPTDNYMREFHIDTETDLTGKTVWISIGGYLHTSVDEVFSVNDKTGLVGVNLEKVDIPRRIAHSSQLIDLSSLGIFNPDWSPTLFNLNDLKTHTVMQRYLTLSQTFVIIIDTQNIQIQHEPLDYTGVIGVYKCNERRSYAVTNQYGLFQYYAAGKIDDDKMSVLIPPDLTMYNGYDTTHWETGPTYSEDYRLRFNDRYPLLHVMRILSTDMMDEES